MSKEEIKAYFDAHPTETELFEVGNQVYMGSQKVAAESYARSEKLDIKTHNKTTKAVPNPEK
jgi:hypothetical protein